ncbi:uncharacterized oxidoreductase [[Candida] jaroonii]|uniref:Uncharacterized oxidoreductase n=1 Tax=[Candida] jaroonii TaxID=467808 RepID=A0ACA9YDN4_9ASCO|nr:uncharacterized oxidoreductase [[Candida] jaroonii]
MSLIKLNNGSVIPSIGLGTYNISSNVENLVYQALKKGYRHVDTAVLYGNEYEVGQGIDQWVQEGNSRDEVFYTTKLWSAQSRGSRDHYTTTKKEIEDCLKSVKPLKYIDLLLIHSPLCGPERRKLAWKAMEEAVEEGKVKNIGVSNYGEKHLKELFEYAKIKPVVNQIEISPWLMREDLVKFCLDNDIAVEAYAPLTHGYKLSNPPSEVKVLMDKYQKDAAQILIKWSLQKGLIPLPKTSTIGRLSGNLNVDFTLTDEEMKSLDHPDAYEPTDWECTDCP